MGRGGERIEIRSTSGRDNAPQSEQHIIRVLFGALIFHCSGMFSVEIDHYSQVGRIIWLSLLMSSFDRVTRKISFLGLQNSSLASSYFIILNCNRAIRLSRQQCRALRLRSSPKNGVPFQRCGNKSLLDKRAVSIRSALFVATLPLR